MPGYNQQQSIDVENYSPDAIHDQEDVDGDLQIITQSSYPDAQTVVCELSFRQLPISAVPTHKPVEASQLFIHSSEFSVNQSDEILDKQSVGGAEHKREMDESLPPSEDQLHQDFTEIAIQTAIIPNILNPRRINKDVYEFIGMQFFHKPRIQSKIQLVENLQILNNVIVQARNQAV
ncbi:MAG: hypothetical protein EZS28_016203 [Streblomastix strix]|uniref:Uncharacterized protein n=1 Tax=Streblomastix strix TaxID=222440 RepID=A0A5J4W0G1_9EUKA|nr:MAG: hypothetical protein EZS28_016203 [Streblomastix strix]